MGTSFHQMDVAEIILRRALKSILSTQTTAQQTE
jgi:hypothetical protein